VMVKIVVLPLLWSCIYDGDAEWFNGVADRGEGLRDSYIASAEARA